MPQTYSYLLVLLLSIFTLCGALPVPDGLPLCKNTQELPCIAEPRTDMVVVFEDNFNSFNSSAWMKYEGTHSNGELEYYTADNVYVSNGNLILKSQKQQYNGHNYTSGEVRTQGKFSHTYGRWEVSARLPFGKGMWPAHWLMPEKNVCWPMGGEIDIMENLGNDMSTLYGHYHFASKGCGDGHEESQGTGYTAKGVNLANDFHVYAVEWSPGLLEFFFDSVKYVSIKTDEQLTVPSWPFYWILNTAVGGDWPGNPDSSTKFPQYHYIDYVKVLSN
mmetsp:Transcript_6776/g.7415  ORF Transcript_6776/g.7415 Transcript_6776/m.7415 type:complete len:275 (-) Transcript_6776:11-835(-)